jgi:hypothetical protein
MKPYLKEVKIKPIIEAMAEIVEVVNEDDYAYDPSITEEQEKLL